MKCPGKSEPFTIITQSWVPGVPQTLKKAKSQHWQKQKDYNSKSSL
jgi:hypothetical protein